MDTTVALYSGNLNDGTVAGNVMKALKSRNIPDTTLCFTTRGILVMGTKKGVDVAVNSTKNFTASSWTVRSANMATDLNELRDKELQEAVSEMRDVWRVLNLLPTQILGTLRNCIEP